MRLQQPDHHDDDEHEDRAERDRYGLDRVAVVRVVGPRLVLVAHPRPDVEEVDRERHLHHEPHDFDVDVRQPVGVVVRNRLERRAQLAE